MQSDNEMQSENGEVQSDMREDRDDISETSTLEDDTEEIDNDGELEQIKYAVNAYELNQMSDVSAATRQEEGDDDDDDAENNDERMYNEMNIDEALAHSEVQPYVSPYAASNTTGKSRDRAYRADIDVVAYAGEKAWLVQQHMLERISSDEAQERVANSVNSSAETEIRFVLSK